MLYNGAMSNQVKKLAIVGGGASGLAAAVMAGDYACELGLPLEIVVYERDDRVGRTILATGNGRCNFSNQYISAQLYRNAEFVHAAYEAAHVRFGSDCVTGFFENLGLAWRQEPDGRLLPLANKASVVLDVLRAAARELGVRETCGSNVREVRRPRAEGKPCTLHMVDGVLERADAVIVACGGRALEKLAVEGAETVPLSPVLGPLKVAAKHVPTMRELDNIRIRGTVTLVRPQREEGRQNSAAGERLVSETGEIMFRKYGVSGVCVFNVSRFAQPGDVLQLNLLGDIAPEQAAEFLSKRRSVLVGRYGDGLTNDDLLRGLLLPRVSEAVLKSAGIDSKGVATRKGTANLARLLAAYPLEVAGIGDPDLCQVRRGGLAVGQFDPASMQLRGARGLYATGEALDVDGPCGGYNLHWAWTSGMLAACSVVEQLKGVS